MFRAKYSFTIDWIFVQTERIGSKLGIMLLTKSSSNLLLYYYYYYYYHNHQTSSFTEILFTKFNFPINLNYIGVSREFNIGYHRIYMFKVLAYYIGFIFNILMTKNILSKNIFLY